MGKKIALLLVAVLLTLTTTAVAGEPLTPQEKAWLRNHGPIRVGSFSDYPPYAFVDDDGKPVGMAIDYWNLLAAKLGAKVSFTPAEVAAQQLGLSDGVFDSLTGLFPVPSRRLVMDFSKPICTEATFIYTGPRHKNINKLSELKGLRTAAVKGDAAQEQLQSVGLVPTLYDNYETAIDALAADLVDAVCVDHWVGQYFIAKKGLEGKIFRSSQPVVVDVIALPVQKNQPELLAIINKGIDALGPSSWRAIEQKWLK